jgi:hypothetical protein
MATVKMFTATTVDEHDDILESVYQLHKTVPGWTCCVLSLDWCYELEDVDTLVNEFVVKRHILPWIRLTQSKGNREVLTIALSVPKSASPQIPKSDRVINRHRNAAIDQQTARIEEALLAYNRKLPKSYHPSVIEPIHGLMYVHIEYQRGEKEEKTESKSRGGMRPLSAGYFHALKVDRFRFTLGEFTPGGSIESMVSRLDRSWACDRHTLSANNATMLVRNGFLLVSRLEEMKKHTKLAALATQDNRMPTILKLIQFFPQLRLVVHNPADPVLKEILTEATQAAVLIRRMAGLVSEARWILDTTVGVRYGNAVQSRLSGGLPMLYNNEQPGQEWQVKLIESNAVRVGGRLQQARADDAKLDERIVVVLPYESELGPKAAAEGLERLQAVPIHKGVIIVPVHNRQPPQSPEENTRPPSAADSFRQLLQQSERGTWREQKFGRLQVFYVFRNLPVPDNDRLRSILGANLQFM